MHLAHEGVVVFVLESGYNGNGPMSGYLLTLWQKKWSPLYLAVQCGVVSWLSTQSVGSVITLA